MWPIIRYPRLFMGLRKATTSFRIAYLTAEIQTQNLPNMSANNSTATFNELLERMSTANKML